MNILPQNYNDLLNNLISDAFSSILDNNLNFFNSNGNVMNYVNLLSNLDESLSSIARNTIVSTLESLDLAFKNSIERKRKYHIKSRHTRTILTIFGEISFTRTFYTSKLNGKNFCYVDRTIGLNKYDYFDPYLKALIVEYASNNSFPKVAKYINDLIGNRVSIQHKHKFISRQTVRNIILSSNLSKPNIKQKPTPESLYIIADEKWIHTQNNNNNDIMVKSIVLFENVINHKLHNKMIFASYDNSFINDCLDYIYYVYDIDKINNIFIIGDGASWIKNLKFDFTIHKDINIIQALDKFHFKQALHHIALNKKLEGILADYVLNNLKKDFIECCDLFIKNYPNRKQTIEAKKQYILNNWKNINNLYKYNLSCPMESQISHNIADLFTSRPKGYSLKTIKKLTELRLLYKNNFNIKELYLNNYNNNKTLNIINDDINFSHFDILHKKETYTILSKKAIISTFY